MNIASWSDRHLERHGDHRTLVFDGTGYSSRELHDASCRLASALIEYGVAPGDRVLLILPACVEVIVAIPAIWRAGAVSVAVYAGISEGELRATMAHCSPRAVIATAEAAARVKATVGRDLLVIAARGPAPAGCLRFDALRSDPAILIEPVPRAPTDIAQIAYTSGTTGARKGVVFTHGGMDAYLPARRAFLGGEDADSSSRVWLVAQSPSSFGGMFAFHRFGQNALYVVLETTEPTEVIAAVQRHSVTDMVLVPSMYESLLAYPDLGDHALSTLRLPIVTGASLSPSLARRIAERLGVPAVNLYGQAEAGGTVTSNRGEPLESVGRPLPGAEIEIRDAAAQPLAIGEVGEIWVRTRWMSPGYYQAPDETAAAFTEGWLRTGDLGRCDGEGYLYLVGRSKEVIIQAGLNVFPQEIVNVIERVPGVRECAVVGISHPTLGEEVIACVVRDAASHVSERELFDHCRVHLEHRKVPARFHFSDELPRTLNGKVQTAQLRASIERAQRTAAEQQRAALARELERADASQRQPIVQRLIITVWSELIGRSDVPPEVALSSLGDSLLALRAVSRLASLGIAVTLQDVFESQTVAALAAVAVLRSDAAVDEAVIPTGKQITNAGPVLRPYWLSYEEVRANTFLHFAIAQIVSGQLDRAVLARSLEAMIGRHSILRTRFFESGGELLQEVLPVDELPLLAPEYADLSSLDEPAKSTRLREILVELHERPFDLDRAPIRSGLVRLDPSRHLFSVCVHHIAFDQPSIPTFLSELWQIYAALEQDASRDEHAVIEPRRLQHIDYSDYLVRFAASARGAECRRYWDERLDGAASLELPVDFDRTGMEARRKTRPGGFLALLAETTPFATVDAPVWERVLSLARVENTTPYAIILACIAAQLRGTTGQDDLCFQTTLSQRFRPGLEDIIGVSGLSVIMRVDAAGSPTYRDLLRQVRATVLAAYEHSDVDVIGRVSPGLRRMNVNYVRLGAARSSAGESVPGLRVERFAMPAASAPRMPFDLMLLVRETRADARADVGGFFSAELFRPSTAIQLRDDFVATLHRMLEAPDGVIRHPRR